VPFRRRGNGLKFYTPAGEILKTDEARILGALAGLRIGVYQHSSVARDILTDLVLALGATPVALARSGRFIPVDTEAVDPETRTRLSGWCRDHRLDAVISTDGDADRPMLADHTGRIVAGDVLGRSARGCWGRIISARRYPPTA
jgi:phosphomannomutase